MLELNLDEHPFFVAWIAKQSKVSSGTWLVVKEEIEERADDGTWSAPRIRTIAVNPGGRNNAVTVAQKLVAAARTASTIGGIAVGAKARTTKVTVWPMTQAFDYDKGELFRYGAFPVVPNDGPGDMTDNGLGVRVKYISLRMAVVHEANELNTKRLAELGGPDNDPQVADGVQGERLWKAVEINEENWDAQANATITEFGTRANTVVRVTDGAPRQAFRTLMAQAIQGYEGHSERSGHRMILIRRLMAVPRMFCVKLVGKASPRIRDKFERQQLAGAMCIQSQSSRARAAAPPSEGADTPMSPQDLSDACTRKCYGLVRQGYVGKGAAALVRKQTPDITPEQKIADLTKLHPLSDEPVLPQRSVFEEFIYTTGHVTIEALRKRIKAACCSSAPGPDGLTFEMLHDAMEHDGFARNFRAIVIDYCNGNIDEETSEQLAAATLVGIPKGDSAADGTRPLACGGTISKVASATALYQARTTTAQIFRGSQFGCSSKGGADFIVHRTRAFVRYGRRLNGSLAPDTRVGVTIDFANAFNSVTRQSMWDAVKNIPELRGAFSVAYGRHSTLHISGTDATLVSACGARQGTVDGPVVFALAIQPLIRQVNSLLGVEALAYLDDITLLCDNMACAARAVATLKVAAAQLGLMLKEVKCEMLYCLPMPTARDASLDSEGGLANSSLAQFRIVQVIKLLGASIGRSDDAEAEHLFAREADKTTLFFQRLRRGASPQLFTVLRQCGVPKLSHACRVHSPRVSRRLCQIFDARVEETIAHWSSVDQISDVQRLIMSLPRAMGGLGLTRMELIAGAAYHASYTTAMNGAARVSSQATLCAAVYADQRDTAIANDAALARHLEVYALEGSDAGLSYIEASVHPDVYGALLRTRLRGAPRAAARVTSLTCPGCTKTFPVGGEYGEHVAGCAIVKGGHVTKRHNQVVGLLRNLMTEAGDQPDATEPRDLKLYRCHCGLQNMTHTEYETHRQSCQHLGGLIHASGPDLRYRPLGTGKVVVADVTVRNLCNRTSAAKHESAEAMFQDADVDKRRHYENACRAANQELHVLAATANGHLSKPLAVTLNRLADATFRARAAVRMRASAMISHGTAAARLHAEELAGVRPRSIDLQQVQLAERFAINAVAVDAAEKQQVLQQQQLLGPVLGAAPPPMPTLEERITNGIAQVLRAALPQLFEQWVLTARRVDQERRSASAGRDEEQQQQQQQQQQGPLLPTPTAILQIDDETATLRARISAEASEEEHRAYLRSVSDRCERVEQAREADIQRAEQAMDEFARAVEAQEQLLREENARAARAEEYAATAERGAQQLMEAARCDAEHLKDLRAEYEKVVNSESEAAARRARDMEAARGRFQAASQAREQSNARANGISKSMARIRAESAARTRDFSRCASVALRQHS